MAGSGISHVAAIGAGTIGAPRVGVFPAGGLSIAAGADFAQQNAVARKPLKRKLLRRLDAVVPASLIAASVSSDIPSADPCRGGQG